MKQLLLLLLSAIILTGCSSSEKIYYDKPYEFIFPEKKKEFIDKYSPYLKGKKIFLDPGHGGEDRRSVGPEKLVVEADANLNVSLALKDYLKEAGVQVIMSRETDKTVDLKERSYMANRSGADIFISVHHNAPGTKGDNWTNYTSTYYHAKETDYEYEPSERDLARFVQRDMAYAMRNSGGLGSFDGTYSDYWIYPGAGFSVLRVTEIPAILVECGFFTHYYEEKRLAQAEFNKIQAWGIFRGICRYFSAGIPVINFLNESENFIAGNLEFNFILKDSSGINPSSIKVQFDSTAHNHFSFDEQTGKLNIKAYNVKEGNHNLRIIAANKNGNHTFPFHREISVTKK